MLGNGAGQAIQLLSVLVLSRLYEPGSHGVLGQIQSYATVFAIVATLQLHLSIPLSRDRDSAHHAASIVTIVALGFALTSIPLAMMFGGRFVVAAILALFIGLSNTYNSFLIFSGNFGKISRFYVFRSIFIVFLQIALALQGVKDGLLWGAVLGEAATAIYLARVSNIAPWPVMARPFAAVVAFLRARKSFALFGTLQELVSVSAFYSPLLLLGLTFGDALAGQYSMASRLVWAPAVLLSGSLAQVLYHDFGQRQRTVGIAADFLWLPHKAYYLVLALAPLVCYALQDLIVLALGSDWLVAANFMPVMLAWACIFIASTPARVVCRMMHLQRFHLFIDALALAAIIFLFLVLRLGPQEALYGIVAVACLQTGGLFLTSLYAVDAQQRLKS